MIKVKTNTTEIKVLARYLQSAITEKSKTNNLVMEFFIAFAIKELLQDLNAKVFKHENNGSYYPTVLTLKIDYAQLLALSIYFKRYAVPSFILKLESDILKQMTSEIITVIKNGNSPEGSVSDLDFLISEASNFD